MYSPKVFVPVPAQAGLAECVQILQSQCFVAQVAVVQVINILRCSWVGRGVRRASLNATKSSSLREHILPVRDAGHAWIVSDTPAYAALDSI